MSTFGKIGGHMKVGWIEQKFCICGPDRNFGAARLCAARHYTTFIILLSSPFPHLISIQQFAQI